MTEIEPIYDPKDDFLWRHLKSVPAFRGLLRAVEARFYQVVDLPGPILDVGCGDGHFAQMVFDRQITAGIDPWWGPLNKAKRSEMYGQVLQGMGNEMPFPDHTFASAFSNSVLEHIPDVQSVLNETSRVMQTNGRFLITMPSQYFTQNLGGAAFFEKLKLDGLADKYRDGFNFISRHEHTDAPEIWAERLAKAGFAIERWQYYFSKEALRALEIGHAQGMPSAILHALTGQWLVAPWRSSLTYTDKWLRPFYNEEAPEHGAYLLFVARKVADGPIETTLPAQRPFTIAELEQPAVVNDEWTVDNDQWSMVSDQQTEVSNPPISNLQSSDESITQPSVLSMQSFPKKRWAYIPAFLLAFIAYRFVATPGSEHPTLAILSWLTAIGLGGYALSDSIRWPRLRVSRFTMGATAVLFLVALITRYVNLTTHPFILDGGEAALGIEMVNIRNGLINNPFGTGWLTNPTLPLHLLGGPIAFLGQSILSVRLLSPIAGALTVVATFLFGQRLWNREVGLVAAILLLASPVHLQYSRLGLTNIWDPLFTLLALGLVAIAWQAHHERKRWLWLLTGGVIGLNAYFFTSSHLLPLMLVAFFLLTAVGNGRSLWAQKSHIFAGLLLALLIALPLMLHYRANDTLFMERARATGILAGQTNWLNDEAARSGQSTNEILGQQFQTALLAFISGADNSASFRAQRPLLNFVASILFLGGSGIALWRIRRIPNQLLIVWLLVTAVFGGALLLQPPQSHRYLIALPAMCLTIAIGLVTPLQHLLTQPANEQTDQAPNLKYLLALLSVTMLMAFADMRYYFGPYQESHVFADRNTEIAHQIGMYLNGRSGDEWTAYLYGAPIIYSGFPTIPFLAPHFVANVNLYDIIEPETQPPASNGATGNAFIYLPERLAELDPIQQTYPDGTLQTITGFHSDPLFYIYETQITTTP